MKKQWIKRIAPVLLTALWLTACEQVDKLVPQMQASATLNGQSVRPTRSGSPATGTFSGTIDPNSQMLAYTLMFSPGLQPTSVYLYRITNPADSSGVADVSLVPDLIKAQIKNPTTGPIIVTNPVVPTSPFSATVALTQAKIDSIRRGYYYISVGTAAYPTGEIQGRLTVHQ